MPRLLFSARCRTDLVEIWARIAADSLANAEAVHERIHARCEKLIDQPKFGHPRNDVKRGLRCLNTDGYIIFYRITVHAIQVSRIVHHSRRLDRLTFDEP